MKKFGIPSLSLWPVLLKRRVTLHVHEDNTVCIRVMETGKNLTMRHTHRTQRISISWLHEVMKDPDVWLQHCSSDKMRADIFTKAFHQKDKWTAARQLINILDPSELHKQITDSANDLSANDKPTSVWDKASTDEGIAKVGGTSSAMEDDHDPQVSGNLVACAATSRVNRPRSSGVKLKSMRSYVRTLIEVCCDANSKMGIKFEEAKGVRHIRVTMAEDFLKVSTLEWILSLIEGERTLIWFSMPCTGGCPWIYLNKHKQNGLDKINDHRKIMKMMWRHFEIIAKRADKVNAWVVNEWPLNCQYWKDPKVQRFFQTYVYDFVVVHGCMAGLRS
ncbi:MAG: hypothetical protein MUP94_10135, partial [Flavobacteriales bacterium]|nr:hypothetical protein [Flavobacteriales bacterium]